MTIGTVCGRETIVAKKSDTVADIARLMRQHHVGDIVIVEESEGENIPVGIVTDRDLVIEILAQELSSDAVTAGDLGRDDIVTARETDGIWETIQQMRIKGVRRMPVINQHGGLVGIVTLDDLLELLADELAALARTVKREQERERAERK